MLGTLDLNAQDSSTQTTRAPVFRKMRNGWLKRYRYFHGFNKRELAPIINVRSHQAFTTSQQDTLFLNAVEVGFGSVQGNHQTWDAQGISWGSDWKYSTLPYVTLEYRFAQHVDNFKVMGLKGEVPSLMLNVGVSGGGGFRLLVIPMGINGTAGISTDFQDVFARVGIGYDLYRISIGSGAYLNLTKNGALPNYMDGSYVNVRYMLWNK